MYKCQILQAQSNIKFFFKFHVFNIRRKKKTNFDQISIQVAFS